MAAPTPSGFVTTDITSATTSHAVNIPAAAVAGERVVIGFGYPVTGQTITGPASGVIAEQTNEQALGGTNGLYTLVYEVQGAETQVTIGTSISTKSASVACLIQGDSDTDAPEIVGTNGSNGPPDPPSSNVPPASADYLFIALGSMGGETALTAAPTNYSNFTEANTGTAGAVTGNSRTAIGTRQLTTAVAENPGAFTGGDATQEWAATTVMLYPAGGGGGVSGSAASVVNVTSAGDGDVLVSGSAATTVQASSAADGDVLVAGAAATVINLTQVATGAVAVAGSAASVVNVESAATGTNLVSGAAATVINVTQAATGTVGEAGLPDITGSAASIINATQSADGDVLVSGSGASTIQLTQTAEGDVLVSGTGASVVNLTQVAEGDVLVSGTGESSIDVASVATGAVAVSGSAASQIAVSQSASGAVTEPPRGTIASIINVLSSATGTTPFIEPVGSPFNAGKLPYPGPLWKRKRMYR